MMPSSCVFALLVGKALLLVGAPALVTAAIACNNLTTGSTECSNAKSDGPLTPTSTALLGGSQIPRDDGYKWPNLYSEADSMLDVALLTYAYASVRKYARANPDRYEGAEEILKDDRLTAGTVLNYVKMNQASFEEDEEFDGGKGVYPFKVLSTLVRRLHSHNCSLGDEDEMHAEIDDFDDKDSNTELVYGVGVNHVKKRIVVSFRGTVTRVDTFTDIKVKMVRVNNPFYGTYPKQKQFINIHGGFHEYMFQDDDGNKTKYENILDEVKKLSISNPDYKLYVTGHSLGAALASMFAFLAASQIDEIIPRPVTCVSIASPLVGDKNWRNAFELAERLGKIRYLRITNYRDVVPTVPYVSLPVPILYKHVGIHLQLYGGGKYRLSYPKNGRSAPRDVIENSLPRNLFASYLTNHGNELYDTRLESVMAPLEELQLNDLYADENFIGGFKQLGLQQADVGTEKEF